MEDKLKLTKNILSDILDRDFYEEAVKNFVKELGLDYHKINITYDDLIQEYKNSLEVRLIEYFDKIYTLEDLIAMTHNENSSLYYEFQTTEYKDIIHAETAMFLRKLGKIFLEKGLLRKKQNWWSKIKGLFKF